MVKSIQYHIDQVGNRRQIESIYQTKNKDKTMSKCIICCLHATVPNRIKVYEEDHLV